MWAGAKGKRASWSAMHSGRRLALGLLGGTRVGASGAERVSECACSPTGSLLQSILRPRTAARVKREGLVTLQQHNAYVRFPPTVVLAIHCRSVTT